MMGVEVEVRGPFSVHDRPSRVRLRTAPPRQTVRHQG
jgi:hypothetical protein